jgi:REP element-mobilizing transposase RayT
VAKDKSHSSKLRENRCSDEAATFFLTKCLQPRKWVLHRREFAGHIVEALTYSVTNDRIMLRSFCVMPDHWHALLYVKPPFSIPELAHSVDSFIGAKTAKALAALGTGWQDGYQETRIRSTKQFFYVRRYIERNPTDKGLVRDDADWQWSSLNSDHAHLITQPWPWGFEQDND